MLIPHLNITLSIEIDGKQSLRDLKTQVESTLQDDTPLEVYRYSVIIIMRFKYKKDLLTFQDKICDHITKEMLPNEYIIAYPKMTGA